MINSTNHHLQHAKLRILLQHLTSHAAYERSGGPPKRPAANRPCTISLITLRSPPSPHAHPLPDITRPPSMSRAPHVLSTTRFRSIRPFHEFPATGPLLPNRMRLTELQTFRLKKNAGRMIKATRYRFLVPPTWAIGIQEKLN